MRLIATLLRAHLSILTCLSVLARLAILACLTVSAVLTCLSRLSVLTVTHTGHACGWLVLLPVGRGLKLPEGLLGSLELLLSERLLYSLRGMLTLPDTHFQMMSALGQAVSGYPVC